MRNESETRTQLIDPVLHAKGWEKLIKREETLGRIIVAEGLRHAHRAPARTDYTLRVPTARGQEIVVGILEAKAESEPPGQGLDQSKRYARRLNARFIFSTNGHRKGKTERIWYYDLSDLKIGKKNPLTLARMEGLLEAASTLAETERSWFVSIEEIEAKGYDLKAVNPNRKVEVDPRTSSEILSEIEARHEEITAALQRLRSLIADD